MASHSTPPDPGRPGPEPSDREDSGGDAAKTAKKTTKTEAHRLSSSIEGKYRVLAKLSEGGMGAVYKVRHRMLDEIRVVKVIRSQLAHDDRLRERFLREARASIHLRHPGIAQVFDFSLAEDGTAYMVMEMIDGVNLAQLRRTVGPLEPSLATEVAIQALAALGYLHGRGYVHRDVAPDNLMLGRGFDGEPAVKLIDLGIAKRIGDRQADLTATGAFLGKVRYSSPEQFGEDGASQLDQRSDLYSFGVVLYELLTGVHPITGQELGEIIAGHLFRPPRSFDETDPDGRVPEELRRIVLATLAKRPAERPSDADELMGRLEPLRGGSQALADALDVVFGPTRPMPRREAGTGEESPATAADPDPTGPTPSRRSLQNRLDDQFGAGTTPHDPVAEGSAAELEAALVHAELLLQLEDWTRVHRELAPLVDRHPDDRRLQELLERAEDGRATARRGRRRPVDETGPEVESLLTDVLEDPALSFLRRHRGRPASPGRANGGETPESEAIPVAPTPPRLAPAGTDAGELKTLAGELFEAERWEEAHGTLRQALALEPEDETAWDLLGRIAARLEADRDADDRRRQEAIAGACRSIASALVAGQLDLARRQLRFARRTWGDHPDLELLADQLEDALST